ncbi:MAG TPA: hypothetical protein VLV78_12590 [Thermoanaerobaculia bacterium]|nr:hypothetical protein [Thermoanaerobaculia bacterium]
MPRFLVPVVLFLTITSSAIAKDAWVLIGQARGPQVACNDVYTWYTDTIFHNLGTTVAKVSLVGQGVAPLITQVSFDVPAKSSVALSKEIGRMPPSGMNIAHFDVGDGVFVESRLEVRYDQPCVAIPPAAGPSGKIGFPVFDHLVPAGELQVHFGTDLGFQRSRVNVGVYNAASVPATAHVELRNQACFPATQAKADVVVPPNTLVQTSLAPGLCEFVENDSTPPWVRTTVVTVDQPSLSYATPVSNQQSPNVSFGVGTPRG